MQTSIVISDGAIHVQGPYSDKNNKVWRSLGGKFYQGTWIIPDTSTSREEIAKLFGTKSEVVEVVVPSSMLRDDEIVQIGGYVLANRRGRDSAVTMPDGVTLHKGKFPSYSGSRKNPTVGIHDDVEFILQCRSSFADANNLHPATNTPDIEI